MTVKELIDELKKFNRDAEIQIQRDNFTYDFSVNVSPSENKQISHTDGTVTYKYKIVLRAKETNLTNFMYNLRQP